MPRREGALSGETVEDIVKTALRVHRHPQILSDIQEAGTSCMVWGTALQSLFVDNTINHLYTRTRGRMIESHDWYNIKQELLDGKVVFAAVNLPETDHVFTIVGDGQNAYILHAWQDQHGLRSEHSMPVDRMINLLRKLTKYDYTKQVNKIREVRRQLWGEDHMGPTEIARSQRRRASFTGIASGESKRPFIENRETLERLTMDLAEWQSRSSRWANAAEMLSEEEPLLGLEEIVNTGEGQAEEMVGAGEGSVSVAYAVGFGAALGFVLGAGGALYYGAEWDEVLEEGIKTGVALGVGEGLGAAVGGSVVRSNAVAGAATFGVIALWDVAKWAKHDITGVQLRKKLTQGAVGTVGGVAGGIAAGTAGGALFGPIGAFVGGIFGGIAGGISGAIAGEALDEAIWDEGEDSVMNTYQFFGWYNVDRGTRPIKSAKEIRRAYLDKLDDKLSQKFTDKEWATVCTAHLMVLLRAMFPGFKRMLEISKNIHEKKSNGVSIVGSIMYSNFSVPHRTEELIRQQNQRQRTSILSTLRRGCFRFCECCCILLVCCCCCGCRCC